MGLVEITPVLKEEIREYIKEIKEKAEAHRKWRLEASKRNEAYYYGEQTLGIGKDGVLRDTWNRHYRPVSYNYLRTIVNVVASRITKDRPSASAYPGSEQEADRVAAEIAKAYIEHHEIEVGADDIIHSIAYYGVLHGTAGLKVMWDVDQERMFWEPVEVFQFYLDPAARRGGEDAKWVMFVDYKESEWDVAHYFPDLESMPELERTKYRTSVGTEEQEGIECLELWHLPTRQVPMGLYVKMIGGVIVEAMEYPDAYIFPNRESGKGETPVLPFVLFRCLEHRGTSYGDTWLDDCIDIQDHINRVQSGLQFLEEMTANIKVVVPDNLAEAWNENSQIIKSSSLTSDNLFWTPQPQIPQILIANREDLVKDLFNIAGVNQMSAGMVTPKASASARQVAYVYELDSEKHSGSFKSLQRMIERAWYITLNVSQRVFTPEHFMRIAGKSGLEVQAYLQADLAGVDVRVEPRAGQERWSAQRGVQAGEDYQMGLLSPEDALELRTTGQKSSYTTANEKIVLSEIEGVLRGAAPSLQAEPSVAIQTINEYIALLLEQGANQNYVLVLQQLLSLYQERAAQAQQPAQ